MQELAERIFYDNAVTNRVIKVIEDANHHLVLVSPYVDRVGHVEQALQHAKAKGVEIVVVVRKDDSALGGRGGQDAIKWFNEQSITVLGVPNLHAKFYVNDTDGVVTSMNLLRSSWSSSLEFGVFVTGDEHHKLVEYFGRLKALSTPIDAITVAESVTGYSTANKPAAKSNGKPPYPRRRASSSKKPAEDKAKKGRLGAIFSAVKEFVAPSGFCIRCGETLSSEDVQNGKVLCSVDYRSWARFKDEKYAEKYCTNCGTKARTTFARPRCHDCYANG